jgi:hypothetical protein
MPLDVVVDTGDLDKITEAMEKKGAEFAEYVVNGVKRKYEVDRRLGMAKFHAIKRAKSGKKRFAAPRPAIPSAEQVPSFAAKFVDTFFKGAF